MTKQQMEWAKQHDWYVRESMWGPNSFVVSVIERHSEGKDVLLQFADYQELRAWAGY